MNKQQYERAVTDVVAELLNCSNSDAQGVVEANQNTLNDCFAQGCQYNVCAEFITEDAI